MNLHDGPVTVVRGNGGRGRLAPFSAQTAPALDRYLRARRTDRRAETGSLWVGGGGKGFGYHGLNAALKDRAKTAGIEGFHRTSAATHRRDPLAASRWFRRRIDACRGVANPLDGRSLYGGVGIRAGRRRGPRAQSGRVMSVDQPTMRLVDFEQNEPTIMADVCAILNGKRRHVINYVWSHSTSGTRASS